MGRLSENCVLSIKNKSHSITAEIVGAGEGRRGRDHRPGSEHRRLEPLRQRRQAQVLLQLGRLQALHGRDHGSIPAGEHQVRMEFAYAGGGLGKGGKVTLYTDGKKVGEGNIDATLANGLLCRRRRATSVRTTALRSPRTTVRRATPSTARSRACSSPIAEAAENADHLVDPETAIRVAMARQ